MPVTTSRIFKASARVTLRSARFFRAPLGTLNGVIAATRWLSRNVCSGVCVRCWTRFGPMRHPRGRFTPDLRGDLVESGDVERCGGQVEFGFGGLESAAGEAA